MFHFIYIYIFFVFSFENKLNIKIEDRLAGVLSDFGCTIVPGKEGRIRPEDNDICLSILDYATPEAQPSPTRALNTLANRAVRTVCVGADGDLQVQCALHCN